MIEEDADDGSDPVRIRYEEAGSGFPLLLIAGGGLNSVIAGLPRSPFNPIEELIMIGHVSW
jgi:hypothetical protein